MQLSPELNLFATNSNCSRLQIKSSICKSSATPLSNCISNIYDTLKNTELQYCSKKAEQVIITCSAFFLSNDMKAVEAGIS